jgi:hypothetical protein
VKLRAQGGWIKAATVRRAPLIWFRDPALLREDAGAGRNAEMASYG